MGSDRHLLVTPECQTSELQGHGAGPDRKMETGAGRPACQNHVHLHREP